MDTDRDPELERLSEFDEIIQRVAREFGLEFFPQEFDIIPEQKMLEPYSVTGFFSISSEEKTIFGTATLLTLVFLCMVKEDGFIAKAQVYVPIFRFCGSHHAGKCELRDGCDLPLPQ